MWIELTTGMGRKLFNLAHFYTIEPNANPASKHKSVIQERDPDGTTSSHYVEESYADIKDAMISNGMLTRA